MIAQGMWIEADGSAHPACIKGGPLFDALHGITRRGRGLSAAPSDLARAYAGAVWAYRCIKLRADAVASVPLVLLDRSGEPINDHPLLRLLRDVNPTTMNLGDLLRATEAAYNIWGVAYWLKVPSRRLGGGPSAIKWLAWLNPQTVEPVVDGVRGITGYRQTIGSRTQVFAPQDLIVFRNFDPLDDLGGLSPLSVALNEINAELNAARFVASFFANDARPAGLLTTDQPMHQAEAERIKTWWQQLFGGVSNKWRTGIVGGGLRWQTISFPPADLALKELREEDRRAICAVFGVPSALAGAWEAATYATAREQKASFYEDTIIPQLEYIAEVLNWSMLPHYPDLSVKGARLDWDLDSITALRESASDKARRLAALFEAGVITRNEVRAGLGMPLLAAEQDGFVFDLAPDPGSSARQAEALAEADVPSRDSTLVRADGTKALEATQRPSLRGELARWERFALRRIKAGRGLRRFESAAIPDGLRRQIEQALAEVQSVEEARAVFDAVADWLADQAEEA